MCSAPQIARSLQKVPGPTILSQLKRNGPTQAPTHSVTLGVGPIDIGGRSHSLSQKLRSYPPCLSPTTLMHPEARFPQRAEGLILHSPTSAPPAPLTPTLDQAHLGLCQLSLEELQRLRVFPLAVLKGLKLLLQFSLKYTQGLHGGEGHTQPGQSSVGSWGLVCP